MYKVRTEKSTWREEILLIIIIIPLCWLLFDWLFDWTWQEWLTVVLVFGLYFFFLRRLLLPAIHTFFRRK